MPLGAAVRKEAFLRRYFRRFFSCCFNNLYFCFLIRIEIKCCCKVTESFHSLLSDFGKEKVKLQMMKGGLLFLPPNGILGTKTAVLRKNTKK